MLNVFDTDMLYVAHLGFGTDKTARQFIGASESEVIFKACQYILNNKE
jgi:hypothetical protein